MERCTNCKATRLERGENPHVFSLGSREFADDLAGFRCTECGETFFDSPAVDTFQKSVARWLVANGYESGDDLRFVRKAAGLRAADLSEAFGVSLQTVSSWENGKHEADAATRQTIGALALDAIDGTTTTRDRLRAMRAPIAKAHVRFDDGAWSAAE